MKCRKADRVLVLVGGAVGAAAGLFAALLTEWADGPRLLPSPARYILTYREPPQPGDRAVFEVEVLGTWRYTKTAPDPRAFDAERRFWDTAPGAAMIGLGLTFGLLVGRWAGRRGSSRAEPSAPADPGRR